MSQPSPLNIIQPDEYRGRFAPSPSGPLHFGSLVAAVGGYLQAKVNKGKWFLRIDDIDPPRQAASAIDDILTCLQAHHLDWDGEVFYQSQQTEVYDKVLAWLNENGLSYYCQCTRKQIMAEGGTYLGHCRDRNLTPVNEVIGADGHSQYSLRFLNEVSSLSFHDELMGDIRFPEDVSSEDFIIKRKDGLYAYHLASVVDDIQQGITEVVRGADLLFPSACQMALYRALGASVPKMLHLPVAVFSEGRKLSKQGHAKGLDNKKASLNLYLALAFLGLPVPKTLMHDTPEVILQWGQDNWLINRLYAKPERAMPMFLAEYQVSNFSY
ncbi:tRNA glutamyl-Q(34) synthetase GluQRS [Alteromonas sp. a30]|uniref:tRNA glutamyl-Q(34) synthetase GluQRS n=1 Tax=Alteromonas sp. a30 TaxID=2730917 RepID=UPI00227FB423|nr:tRNA glutamyl-Q(34) synthetase GluQRS [Alteromonas sp. a30]MCY7296778.1 tRNA glutamyl-Q(34) synthetase GluQRS [Alteromonas sp. a30]